MYKKPYAEELTLHTEEDLDSYTYCVAGAVSELLSEIWFWFDDTKTDPIESVGFGRGLQAVNILRNRTEDLARGVNFFPDDWGPKEMFLYTRRNLAFGDVYISKLKPGPVLEFCRIPLALAHGTLNALSAGENKLNRAAVMEIIKQLAGNIKIPISAGGPSGIYFSSHYPERVRSLTLQAAVSKEWFTSKDKAYKVAQILFSPSLEQYSWKLIGLMSNLFPKFIFKQMASSFSKLTYSEVLTYIKDDDINKFRKMNNRQRSGYGFIIDSTFAAAN
ncbi:squalene/phytoene synthase family protein [Paenibacillus sp. R14(2021)]|uniref:squalene/phytoene synthase family protein n=1 Tax=Paenibacillus sp. R14(2021) TaxID=2859228 RepID=UPI00215866DD|nr:squalene/phytoene synthase family protein [Paenibacillus sp. R14(2021)]